MKRLLIVVCLFLSSIASASDYITVTGSGKTFDEAKQQAFRKAIEFKVGATVLSDVETQNYQRIKDDIYVYSAGFIDDYKILKQENKNDSTIVLLSVLVSESKIKNRILSVGNSSKEFQGDRHSAQISSYLNERIQGEKILQKTLNSYPSKAYTIKQSKYKISLDDSRSIFLNIPYELSWNYEFLLMLRESTEILGNCEPGWKKPCASVFTVLAKNPKDWIIGSTTNHYFFDVNTLNQIHNTFVSNEPRIVLRFYDLYNNYMYGTCYTPRFVWGGNDGFYSNGRVNQITVYGNTKEHGTIVIPAQLEIIHKISKIELTVEAKDICRNQ